MSRHWSEYAYVDAHDLWEFIDQEGQKLDLLSTHDTVESSELCKLLILGRREMLDLFVAFVSQSETKLKTIMTKIHHILSEDEVKRLIQQDYGA